MTLNTLHPSIASAADGALPDWAKMSPARRAHVERVVELMDTWSRDRGLAETDRARWRAAAYLHDGLREEAVADLRSIVPQRFLGWPDAALHGPAAAERLREVGVWDESLLMAISYHTLGHPDLDVLGRALYVADFLEPGRPFLTERRAELRSLMPGSLGPVTLDVVRSRIRHLVDIGVPLLEPTVAFWNALVTEEALEDRGVGG